MIVPFLLGVSATVVTALAVGNTLRARPVDQPTPEGYAASCAPGLVFFAPASDAGRAIDVATGSYGFSHVAVQGCEVGPDGEALLVDCQVGRGVHRASEETYGDRPRGRLLLTGPAAAELYGCARAKVGADFAPFRDSGAYLCGKLALECLPAELQERVRAQSRYAGPAGMVSPNQVAAAFGVRPGAVVIA